MTYTVTIKLEEYVFDIKAASQAQADQIAETRCQSYVEEMQTDQFSIEAKEKTP